MFSSRSKKKKKNKGSISFDFPRTATRTLVVLDLEGVLICSRPKEYTESISVSFQPHDILCTEVENYITLASISAIEFVWNLLNNPEKYAVAFWTSKPPAIAKAIGEKLFGEDLLRHLLFFWTVEQCENRSALRSSCYIPVKNLRRVWEHYPSYGPHNTLIIEDTKEKLDPQQIRHSLIFCDQALKVSVLTRIVSECKGNPCMCKETLRKVYQDVYTLVESRRKTLAVNQEKKEEEVVRSENAFKCTAHIQAVRFHPKLKIYQASIQWCKEDCPITWEPVDWLLRTNPKHWKPQIQSLDPKAILE